MKIALTFPLLLLSAAFVFAYTKDPDSGLLFNDSKYPWTDAVDASRYTNVRAALLVAPDDLPARKHYSNSSMARIEMLALAADGLVQPYRVSEDACEQVFIVLEGQVDFTAGGKKLQAKQYDIVFIPPGLERGLKASGGEGARVLQADWREKGATAVEGASAFIVSEKLRPLEHTGGEGYVTVAPNARQQGNGLSIVGYGASHVNASNSLLLYPHDITTGRKFTANTHLARMGLSAYHPGGGTRWHFHPDREQCFVILSGKGLVEIGANTVEIKPGDVIFAPRHVGHGYKTTGSEPLKFLEIEWGRD